MLAGLEQHHETRTVPTKMEVQGLAEGRARSTQIVSALAQNPQARAVLTCNAAAARDGVFTEEWGR